MAVLLSSNVCIKEEKATTYTHIDSSLRQHAKLSYFIPEIFVRGEGYSYSRDYSDQKQHTKLSYFIPVAFLRGEARDLLHDVS